MICNRCRLPVEGVRAWHDPSDCIHAIGSAIGELAAEFAEESRRAAAAGRELAELIKAAKAKDAELAELRRRLSPGPMVAELIKAAKAPPRRRR